MATNKESFKPVSSVTLADLNRKHQQFHDCHEMGDSSMTSKSSQLDPGVTVHNSRGSRGKVIRVEGGRVVVKLPDGREDAWELAKTFPAAETHDAEPHKTEASPRLSAQAGKLFKTGGGSMSLAFVISNAQKLVRGIERGDKGLVSSDLESAKEVLQRARLEANLTEDSAAAS
jgi:hypothetical protein